MPTPTKVDLYKQFKDEYVAHRKPSIIEASPAQYLAVSGEGPPGSERFSQAIGAMYTVGFTAKMHSKFAGRDYAVCKLEALWWTGRDNGDFATAPPEKWRWKVLIRTPDFITDAFVNETIEKLLAKGKPPEVKWVGLDRVAEGRCVQMLHVGPYEDEPATLETMAAFAKEQGLRMHGRHHEVYLSDPRRVEPARLRTILRRPVR